MLDGKMMEEQGYRPSLGITDIELQKTEGEPTSYKGIVYSRDNTDNVVISAIAMPDVPPTEVSGDFVNAEGQPLTLGDLVSGVELVFNRVSNDQIFEDEVYPTKFDDDFRNYAKHNVTHYDGVEYVNYIAFDKNTSVNEGFAENITVDGTTKELTTNKAWFIANPDMVGSRLMYSEAPNISFAEGEISTGAKDYGNSHGFRIYNARKEDYSDRVIRP